MPKQLGILTVAVGVILIIASLVFFNIAEVRMWFPMTLIVAGVLAFSVSARMREFGVRLAIGSTPSHLLTRILGEGAVIASLMPATRASRVDVMEALRSE